MAGQSEPRGDSRESEQGPVVPWEQGSQKSARRWSIDGLEYERRDEKGQTDDNPGAQGTGYRKGKCGGIWHVHAPESDEVNIRSHTVGRIP